MRKARTSITVICVIAFTAIACFEAAAAGAREKSFRDVQGFDTVSFGTSGELIITQGDRESLEIEALPGDLPNIVTDVRNGTLHIGKRGEGSFSLFRGPVFRLTMRTIAGLEIHSSGSISANGIRADQLNILITSSGSLTVSGSVVRQEVRLSSSGSYSGGNLASGTAKVRVSSSGSATVRVSDSLEAEVPSSGNVRYYGNPPVVNGRVTSSGRLIKL